MSDDSDKTPHFPINREAAASLARSMEHMAASARQAQGANGPRIVAAMESFRRAMRGDR